MTMQQWFNAYGESHQHPTNKRLHWVCVPLIFFTIVGLLSLVPIPFLQQLVPAFFAPFAHLGTLVLVLGIFFFLRLSLSIALGMVLVSSGMLALAHWSHAFFGDHAWIFFLAIFIMSWIGQFVGHKIEGAKPSFFDDLKFLMIGPAWLLHFIYRKVGIPY